MSYNPSTGIFAISSDRILCKLLYHYDLKSPVAGSSVSEGVAVFVEFVYKAVVKLDPDNEIDQPKVIEDLADLQAQEETHSYTLPACPFTAPKGKEFKAWSVDGNELQPGKSIDAGAYTEIKAIWVEVSATPTPKPTPEPTTTPKPTATPTPTPTMTVGPADGTDQTSDDRPAGGGNNAIWLYIGLSILVGLPIIVLPIVLLATRKKK